jgi:RND family efflux transporter MFP subunit
MNLNCKTLFLGICAFLATAVLGGCRQETTGSAGAERPKVGVIQPVQRPVVEYAYFTGQIQAVESVQLRARVTGYLKTICYTPGTKVKENAVLFEIDPLPYQAQLDIAKGKLLEANSQVSVAEARVVQADAQVALNRTKLSIDREVSKTSGAISKLKLEEDEAQVKESQATLEECQASVRALKASVDAAKANLDYNQLHLDWTKVKSPIAGRADRNLLTIGNLVTADVTTLTNIDNADKVYVYFDVDESTCLEIQKEIREGTFSEPKVIPIDVGLQNEKDYPHEGTVDVVANGLNESTGTIKARGILKNPKFMLTPGNFVRVRIAVDRARNKFLVPDRAVIHEQGETFLLVVNGDNTVGKRKVTIGPLDPNDKSLRVIEEGLKGGELVVVEGRQRVRHDVQVEVKQMPFPETPAAPSPSKP